MELGDERTLLNQIYNGNISGRRRKGRSCKTWISERWRLVFGEESPGQKLVNNIKYAGLGPIWSTIPMMATMMMSRKFKTS